MATPEPETRPSPVTVHLNDRELSLLFQALEVGAQNEQGRASPAAMARLSKFHEWCDYWAFLERGQVERPDIETERAYTLPAVAFTFAAATLREAVEWPVDPWVVQGVALLMRKFAAHIELPGWDLGDYSGRDSRGNDPDETRPGDSPHCDGDLPRVEDGRLRGPVAAV